MSSTESFGSMKLDEVAHELHSLHSHVLNSRGRVEIVGDGPESSTVLISKAELDSLENALDILARTPAAAQMRLEVKRVLDQARTDAGLVAIPPPSQRPTA